MASHQGKSSAQWTVLEVKSCPNEIWENIINAASRQCESNEGQRWVKAEVCHFWATGVTKANVKTMLVFKQVSQTLLLSAIGCIVSPQTLIIGWDDVAMPVPGQCFDRATKSWCLHFLRKLESILSLAEKLDSVEIDFHCSEICVVHFCGWSFNVFQTFPKYRWPQSLSYVKISVQLGFCGSFYCLKLSEETLLLFCWVIFVCKETFASLHKNPTAVHSHHLENKWRISFEKTFPDWELTTHCLHEIRQTELTDNSFTS